MSATVDGPEFGASITKERSLSILIMLFLTPVKQEVLLTTTSQKYLLLSVPEVVRVLDPEWYFGSHFSSGIKAQASFGLVVFRDIPRGKKRAICAFPLLDPFGHGSLKSGSSHCAKRRQSMIRITPPPFFW